ncbi:MAG: hypothetical protein K2H50_06555 [Paramuribaculum sp.]|nr:hypothetical protein [Paramuribaculum sp.]
MSVPMLRFACKGFAHSDAPEALHRGRKCVRRAYHGALLLTRMATIGTLTPERLLQFIPYGDTIVSR